MRVSCDAVPIESTVRLVQLSTAVVALTCLHNASSCLGLGRPVEAQRVTVRRAVSIEVSRER